MANILQEAIHRIADALDVISGNKRAFVPGQGTSSSIDAAYGKDDSQSSPGELGNYIATSGNVFACVTLRSDLLASLLLKAYRGKGDQRQEVTSGPLVDLLGKVNPFWTTERWVTMTQRSLDLWGKAYSFVQRGESGKGVPKEIWWAKPTQVRVVPDTKNYIKGFLFYPPDGSQPIFFLPSETLWFHTENPLDEYDGLSPLAASRIAADFGSDALKSNSKIFKNGMQMAGAMFPPKDQSFTKEQADDLKLAMNLRFKGVDNAHRFGVFRYNGAIQEMGITPKDAEFVGGLNFSLEEICRAYRVPLDLMGGQRTYANVDASWKMIWTNTILPIGRFMAGELREQLLPMFNNAADDIGFDASEVAALQQSEGDLWTREREQLEKGAITINEWRTDKGLPKVAWGDVVWFSSTLVPVSSGEPITITVPQDTTPPPEPPAPRLLMAPQTRAITYGSDEHKRLFERFVRRTEKQENVLGAKVAELMQRQKASVLARLKQKERSAQDAADAPFELAKWIKEFRQVARPAIKEMVNEAGNNAMEDVGAKVSFDVSDPNVVRFLEQRAQRFAKRVNETTWSQLKESLSDGIDNGEGLDALIERVEAVMGERIRSSGEAIARTEVIGATNGGTMAAWRQSGVVVGKTWLAALDARTRETHTDAHGQTVDLDKDFTVGGGHGPHPGAIGLPEEDIMCRCSMVPQLDTERAEVGTLMQIRDLLGREIHA